MRTIGPGAEVDDLIVNNSEVMGGKEKGKKGDIREIR